MAGDNVSQPYTVPQRASLTLSAGRGGGQFDGTGSNLCGTCANRGKAEAER